MNCVFNSLTSLKSSESDETAIMSFKNFHRSI